MLCCSHVIHFIYTDLQSYQELWRTSCRFAQESCRYVNQSATLYISSQEVGQHSSTWRARASVPNYPSGTTDTVPRAYDIFRAYEGMEVRKIKINK
jgi:hypothetical protein